MVERQADVHAVPLAATQARRGGQAGKHQKAAVGYQGRFRQAGGARREDVHGGFAQGNVAGVRRVADWQVGARRRDVHGPVGRNPAFLGHDEKVGALGEVEFALDLGDGVGQLAAEYALARRRDGDAVNQGTLTQVGVDEAGGDAEFVGGEQQGEKLDTVFHHDADRVAGGQAGAGEELGVAVRPGIEFSPRDLGVLGDHRHAVAELFGIAFECHAYAVLVGVGPRHQAFFQRQQRR